MHYKKCSLLEVVWSVIKFLVFYIALHMFVNMIFIHMYVFMPSLVIGGILGPQISIWKFIDFPGFNPHSGS